MANTHYEMDETVGVHSRTLNQNLRNSKQALFNIIAELVSMTKMIDTAGSGSADPANFQKIVDQYGVQGADAATKLANAKAIFDQLNSALSGGPEISGNSAALFQMLAELG